jgi:hypothetical protein
LMVAGLALTEANKVCHRLTRVLLCSGSMTLNPEL